MIYSWRHRPTCTVKSLTNVRQTILSDWAYFSKNFSFLLAITPLHLAFHDNQTPVPYRVNKVFFHILVGWKLTLQLLIVICAFQRWKSKKRNAPYWQDCYIVECCQLSAETDTCGHKSVTWRRLCSIVWGQCLESAAKRRIYNEERKQYSNWNWNTLSGENMSKTSVSDTLFLALRWQSNK